MDNHVLELIDVSYLLLNVVGYLNERIIELKLELEELKS